MPETEVREVSGQIEYVSFDLWPVPLADGAGPVEWIAAKTKQGDVAEPARPAGASAPVERQSPVAPVD